MTTYEEELAGLPDALSAAVVAPDDGEFSVAREFLHSGPVYAIASGGAVPAAQFAADLHSRTRSTPAEVLSPLAFVQRSTLLNPGTVLVFSARAKHPDTGFAVRVALSNGFRVVLVTQRTLDDLDSLFDSPLVAVVTVPAPHGSDGFLATQSVLIMAVVAARIYNVPLDLNLEPVPHLTQALAAIGTRLLVVAGADEAAPAADIEVRLHELGLADVQITDYRNLAHGRHVGLNRRRNSTTVLFLTSPSSRALAQKTRDTLPDGVNVVEISTDTEGPAGTLQLLARVMSLPVHLAKAQGISPHRPPVPAFGRDLYHLPFKRLFTIAALDPVARKLRAAGLPLHAAERQLYESAYTAWRLQVMRSHIRAVVLDYDGTCVETRSRWSLPTDDVRAALIATLGKGAVVAFSSGRGQSLHAGLREWVPEEHWSRVWLGLHNGTLMLDLADDMPIDAPASLNLEAAQERLSAFEQAGTITARVSGSQMSLTSTRLSVDGIREIADTVISSHPKLPLRIQASGHSVDIIAEGAGKDEYLRAVQQRADGSALAIGDQGNLGGNDFAMLAATPLSVSVDRCSSDPSRCWNLASPEKAGPRALVQTLGLLQNRGDHLRFVPPALPRAR